MKFFKNEHLILLIIMILVSFIVRFFTYPQVFESDRIVFLETISKLSLWSAGGLAPLFDQTIALISIILGLGKPSLHSCFL